MKRNLTFLTIGIVIGLGIHSFFQERPPLPLTPILQSRAKTIIPTNETEKRMSQTHLDHPKVSANVPRPLEPEKVYGLFINEENVAEMERQRDQLRNYAYATQTAEGWKIQILPEDKVFLKAGLNSGDLITFESMDAQLRNSERAQLARRMVAILHEIQR